MTANNPTQTQIQSQREVRRDLRAILNAAKERKHELAAGTGQDVKQILTKADTFDEAIQRPQEEIIASEIFALATGSALVVAKKLAQGGKSYTPADFVRRLKAHYVTDTDAQEVGASDPSAFDWASVGRRLTGWFRPAPACYHMVGPMAAAPKAKRAVAQRKKKGPIADVVRPDEVAQAGEDKQETDRNMETMWGVLKGCPEGTAPMLELVLNHDSFAQTVENLFTLSFLVRDGKVELKDGTNGEGVVVRHMAGRQHHKKRGGGGGGGDGGEGSKADAERVQFVMTVDFEEWEDWQKVVPRGTTLMPHREHHSLQDGGSGGGGGGGAEQPQGGTQQQQDGEEEEEAAPKKGGRKQRRKAAAESDEEEEEEEEAGPSRRAGPSKRRKSS